MLLNCFVGKTRLWHGQQFLAKTDFEATGTEIFRLRDAASLQPTPTFRQVQPLDTEESVTLLNYSTELPPNVLAVDTLFLDAGVYEVTVNRGEEHVCLPELIWILSKEDYIRLTTFDLSEDSPDKPLVESSHELEARIRSIINPRWPLAEFGFNIYWNSTEPVPFGRMGWIIATVCDSFHYLAVFGLRNPIANVSTGNNTFQFSLEASLEYPVPVEVERTYRDKECSDLQLMQTVKRDEGEEMDFDVAIEYGKARILVQHSMPQLAYA